MGRHVQFELYYIYGLACLHYHIHAACRSADLHFDVSAEKGEEDIEELLVMAFGVGIFAIWHCEQVGLKKTDYIRANLHKIFLLS